MESTQALESTKVAGAGEYRDLSMNWGANRVTGEKGLENTQGAEAGEHITEQGLDSIQVSRLESTKVKRKWRANRTGMGWRTHGPEQVLESGEHTELSRGWRTHMCT